VQLQSVDTAIARNAPQVHRAQRHALGNAVTAELHSHSDLAVFHVHSTACLIPFAARFAELQHTWHQRALILGSNIHHLSEVNWRHNPVPARAFEFCVPRASSLDVASNGMLDYVRLIALQYLRVVVYQSFFVDALPLVPRVRAFPR
jgi:hypothetical protein